MRGARAGISKLASACAALVLLVCASHAAPARTPGLHRTASRASREDAQSSRALVSGLRLSPSPGAAALTIDLDRATTYSLFTLPKPARVVLDLRGSRLARATRLPHARGIVHSVRAGARPHGGLRLVVQLDALAAPGGRVRLPVRAHWSRRQSHATSELVVTIGATSAVAARDSALERVTLADVRAEPRIETDASPHARLERPASVQPAAESRTSFVKAPVVAPVVPPPHEPALAGRDVVIAVDAGHGGQDPGAIGPGGLEEKNVTLAIARALAARLDAEPGMHAVLTRDTDVFLPLRERIRRARAARADLFVSIHADSVHDAAVSGASVYVLSERGATDEAARWLADRENAADLIGGVSLADKGSTLASVLLDLSQSESISASMTAAQRVLASLDRLGEVRKSRVQQAGFVVLKSPDIPSMLIETAYISNPSDERRLRSASEQHRLAGAIFAGLLDYFDQHPPEGTRFAQLRRGGSDAVLAGAAASPAARIAP